MKFKNLYLIGTSHIAKESVEEVQRSICEMKPAHVALELDNERFVSLFAKKRSALRLRDIKLLGIKGFFFNMLGAYLEKKLGEKVGITPGADMKAAAITAKQVGAGIVLIDQHISITLRKLSKRMTWKEKGRLVKDLLLGTFSKRKVKIDLTRVPPKALIEKMTREVKKRYPALYLTLIQERNEIMAQNLYKLLKQHSNQQIIAVVGAGHEKEIINLIKKREKNESNEKRSGSVDTWSATYRLNTSL